MQHEYRLEVMNAGGTMLTTLTDFRWFSVVQQVNHPGLMQVGLKGRHSVFNVLEPGCQVEMFWRDPAEGSAWSRLFTGVFEDEFWQGIRSPQTTLSVFGPLKKLDYRVVNWYSGYTNRSEFTAIPAETVAKTLVEYNAGPSALASNGRKRDGVISGVSVAADNGLGNTVNWNCHGRVLLDTLQALSPGAGGDFDLVKVGDASWEFEFYPGQLGDDLSADVTISKQAGTIRDARYTVRRSRRRTAACIWGQNEGSEREYATATGNGYAANNDRELYVDASDIDDAGKLADRGQAELAENTDEAALWVQVRQTRGCKFGRDYNLGDLVGVINPYSGATATAKVEKVQVSMDVSGRESVLVEVQ